MPPKKLETPQTADLTEQATIRPANIESSHSRNTKYSRQSVEVDVSDGENEFSDAPQFDEKNNKKPPKHEIEAIIEAKVKELVEAKVIESTAKIQELERENTDLKRRIKQLELRSID